MKQLDFLGEVVTVANGDKGTADTSYYYFDNLGYFCLFYTIQNTTLTLEAANDLRTVADTSKTWTDVTSVLTGGATITASGGMIIDTPVPVTRYRVKMLTTNATNALKLFLTRGR